jgi:photoactive yellow protein
MADKLLSTREVSDMLGVGTTSIKRWADEGELECVRTPGGHRRFPLRSVIKLRQLRSTGMEAFPANLPNMTPEELDRLTLGVIELSDAGHVVQYNRRESSFSGRSPESVTGRHFFGAVAPCTNNALVKGAFEEAINAGVADVSIPYTFTYRMRVINVNLRLYRHTGTGTNWLIIDHLHQPTSSPLH